MNMGDSLTHRTVKNSIYSVLGFIFPLVLSFVVMPIIIRHLGSAKFGFFALLNSVVMLFGLLDFGLSYSFVKHLSENRENQDDKRLSMTFSSTVILYAILGAVALVALSLLHGAFVHLFKIPEGFISSFALAFFILGSTFFIKMLAVPLMQIFYALQRQDVGTSINILNGILLGAGNIIVLKTGHGILGLLVMQLISAAFLLLTYYLAWHRLVPELKFVPVLSKQVVKTIGQQGFWVFLSNTMGTILTQMDKFVLGIIWGPTAVGYYTTAQMIPEKISGAAFSLSHVFFPVFSEAASSQQEGELKVKNIFRRSMAIIPVLTAGLATLAIIYGYQLIFYWVSKDFADHTALAIKLLAVTYFFLGFGIFFSSFLSGLKALKFLALSSMITAITNIVFMFLLIPRYSLNGAAWAYLFSAFPVFGYLYYIERKYFLSPKREILFFYGKLAFKIVIVFLVSYLLGKLLLRPLVHNLWQVILVGGLNYLLYLLSFGLLGFMSQEDKLLVKSYWFKFLFYFNYAPKNKSF